MNSDGEKGYIPRHFHNNYSTKPNNNNDSIVTNGNGYNSNTSNNGYENSQQQQQERYLWEIRKRSPNTTPASTVLNSPDLTDIHYNSQHSLHHHQYYHHPPSHLHQIRVGRSPVSQHDDDYIDIGDNNIVDSSHHHYHNQLLSTATTSPGSPTDIGKTSTINLVREGEIVVFDDIDTNWRKTNHNNDSESSHHYHYQDQQHQQLQQQQQQQQQQYQHHPTLLNDDVLKVTKMIGQLPIAEYEGSPRRIGNHQQQSKQQYELLSSVVAPNNISTAQYNNSNNSNECGTKNSINLGTPPSSLYPPRPPGFPQRISPASTKTSTSINFANATTLENMDNNGSGDSNASNQNKDNTLTSLKTANKQNFIDVVDENNTYSNNDEENNQKPKTPTFDYLYEFSETRKVLEEFFKGPNDDEDKKFCDLNESDDLDTHQEYKYQHDSKTEHAYIGQRLARVPNEEFLIHKSRKQQFCDDCDQNDIELYIDTTSRSSGDLADTEFGVNSGFGFGASNNIDGSFNGENGGGGGGGGGSMVRQHSRNFTLSPETTDYDSNCGDLDSLSNDINCQTDFGRLYTSMPVLEDGLSSGHASDTENNLSSVCMDKTYLEMISVENNMVLDMNNISSECVKNETNSSTEQTTTTNTENSTNNCKDFKENNLDSFYSTNISQCTPPPPAPVPHRLPPSQQLNDSSSVSSIVVATSAIVAESQDIQEALKDIQSALQRTKTLPLHEKTVKILDDEVIQEDEKESPIWVPRKSLSRESIDNPVDQCQMDEQQQQRQDQYCHDDEDADTDLETDRLLGQQRLDDHGFYDDKSWSKNSGIKSPLNSGNGGSISNNGSNGGSIVTSPTSVTATTISSATGTTVTTIKQQTFSSATIRQGIGTSLTPTSPDQCQIIGNIDVSLTSPEKLQFTKSPTGSVKSKKDALSNVDSQNNSEKKSKTRNKEGLLDPAVLIEGVLFRARYLGSTQLVCEGQPTKSTRMMQAEEAVSRIKAPEGESQPSTEVDLFISTEKIMVLNTDLKEIMMDHALRTISYIADIGDLVVLMARRRFIPSDNDDAPKPNRTPKMICHVFESDEAQFIAQSIGQAFQVAYMEFLKANGIEDHSFVKEMDYQEVLNSQEIFGDELEIFAKKELQKEVVVPKAKGEILGVVIVESGWGSMLPTVVIANLMSSGAAARCGQLNIGDQLIAINGMSLVGLPLSTCQSYIRNTKNQTAVKFTVVPCPPVVEVKIKRPNTKYQLGFSVQNGVICSLLRGGIAERGGVRVGHRIIEINNQSVVAVPHEKIVNLLATSVGEILMKTMPTSMFRLLTGQENPVYI